MTASTFHHPRLRLLAALALLCGAAGAGACGDDGPGHPSDGGQPGVYRLSILVPPGSSLGLAPGERTLLRVQYLDPADRPVPDAAVSFALQGSSGGAILGGFSAYTDAGGVAEMALTAGEEAAAFAVSVTAPHALAVSFEVAVSEAGFTAVEVVPTYRGALGQAAFAAVRVELRFDERCEDLSPVDGSSPDRQRTVGAFGDQATFQNLPVDVGYAVSVRGLDGADRALAWGCTDLTAGQLLRGGTVRLHVAAEDVVASPAGTFEVQSEIVLPAEAAPALRAPWEAFLPGGACGLGLEQWLLDCVLDAAFPDGVADCVPESADPLAATLRSHRGKLDAYGCRGALTPGGGPSLEILSRDSLDATGLTRRAALEALHALDPADYVTLRLRGQLRVVAGAEDGAFYTWHRLQSVSFPGHDPGQWVALSDVGAAPLAAESLPSTLALGPPQTLTIPPHGLALQPIWAAFRLVWLSLLAPAGLPQDPRDALLALLAGYQGPPSAPLASGCDALAALLCEVLGEPATCLPTACDDALALLQVQLGAGMTTPPPGTADAMFTANVALHDPDGDLRADGLGTPEAPAEWLMTIHLGGAWLPPARATFEATRLATP